MKSHHLFANCLACALLPAASVMAQPSGGGRSNVQAQQQRVQPAVQNDWVPSSDQRRSEIRQTLQAQHQADSLVGPQVGSQMAEPLPNERHLTLEERLELRRQLRLLQLSRQKQADGELQAKP